MPSRVHPDLPAKGAFSPREQYSWDDILGVLEYGRLRGVRVLPEFEMPGHSASWKLSHPEIFADMESTAHPPCCTKPGTPVWPTNWPSPGTPGYPNGCPLSAQNTTLGACPYPNTAMDPASPATLPLLARQLVDWLGPDGLFADAHVHLGGDEVPTTAWSNSRTLSWANKTGVGGPRDAAWMKAKGMSGTSGDCTVDSLNNCGNIFNAIYSCFINAVYNITTRLGKQPTYWIEAWLSTDLPKGAIVQNWYTGDFTYKIAESGHRVIHSPEGNYSEGWCE
jgi:hexosaminidase